MIYTRREGRARRKGAWTHDQDQTNLVGFHQLISTDIIQKVDLPKAGCWWWDSYRLWSFSRPGAPTPDCCSSFGSAILVPRESFSPVPRPFIGVQLASLLIHIVLNVETHIYSFLSYVDVKKSYKHSSDCVLLHFQSAWIFFLGHTQGVSVSLSGTVMWTFFCPEFLIMNDPHFVLKNNSRFSCSQAGIHKTALGDCGDGWRWVSGGWGSC